MLRRFTSALCLLAALTLVPACSAIVNPDTTRLGDGVDAGHGPNDVGPGAPDTGADGGHACPASCDDMIPCTSDACDTASGTCMHMPNDATCGAGRRCSATLGCVGMQCTTNAECADGNLCNGTDACAPGTAGADPTTGCVHGTALDCDDHVACTLDTCVPATGCSHGLDNTQCDDGFACTHDACALNGCTHTTDNTLCAPAGGCMSGASCVIGMGCVGGTTMMCVPDGDGCTADPADCDASTGMCLHPPRDDDGDGFPTAMANGGPCPGGTDCDDTNRNVHPGATEICDGIDNNCNGAIDETGCPGDTCANEQQIMLSGGGGGTRVGMATGANGGEHDDYMAMCGHPGGRDAVYYVDIPGSLLTNAVDVVISTDNMTTSFDTVVAAATGPCSAATFSSARCNDDATNMTRNSRLVMCIPGTVATTATRLHILVDGFDNMSTGTFQVSVLLTPRTGPTCP